VGRFVRTNNESLHIVTSTHKKSKDFSKGIAIGSILHTDKNSHIEPVRYGVGSSFFRTLSMPFVNGKNVFIRLFNLIKLIETKPTIVFNTIFANNYAKRSTVLLFMQTLDSTLQLKLGKITKLKTKQEAGSKPTAFIPEAIKLSNEFGKNVNGIPYANITDMLFGTPTTAHILGGAVMGENELSGVIDKQCKVFNYKNMLVCDGSMISANPGVNPSLSITAISEYAMSQIPNK
jgi:cholesterol oxidase